MGVNLPDKLKRQRRVGDNLLHCTPSSLLVDAKVIMERMLYDSGIIDTVPERQSARELASAWLERYDWLYASFPARGSHQR